MAAIARIDIGLSEQEFWEMTPRQFQLLVKRHEMRILREWQPMACLMALTANCHRDSSVRPQPYSPEDFLPRRAPSRQACEPGPIGPEVYDNFVKAIEGAL